MRAVQNTIYHYLTFSLGCFLSKYCKKKIGGPTDGYGWMHVKPEAQILHMETPTRCLSEKKATRLMPLRLYSPSLSCLSKCHDFQMKSGVFPPHLKCLYLHPANADVNRLTNRGGRGEECQLIEVDKAGAPRRRTVGMELVSRVSVAIVTRKLRQQPGLQKLKRHRTEGDCLSVS